MGTTNTAPEALAVRHGADLAPATELQRLLEAWAADLAREGLTSDTRRTYVRAARLFVEHVQAADAPLDADTVSEWLSTVGTAPTSRVVALAALRRLFSWATRHGWAPLDPTAGVKGPRVPGLRGAHRRDCLSSAEARMVLDAVWADTTPAGARDGALVALALFLALRTVELERAEVDDFGHHAGRRVLAIRGKGVAASPEPMVVAAEPWRYVRRWLDVRPGTSSALFVSLDAPHTRLSRRTIRRVLVGRMVNAGIDRTGRVLSSHSLRHTAVTAVLRGGGDLRQAQTLARHASVVTTERYAHDLARFESAPEDLVAYG